MTSGYQSGNESTLIRRWDQVQQQTQTCIFHLAIGFNYCGVNTLMRVAISGCLALTVEARCSLQTTDANLWKTQEKILTCNILPVYRRFLLDHTHGIEAPLALI